MAESYHHSVSNKLLLELQAGNLTYLICNRNFEPIKGGIFPLVDEPMVKKLLVENAFLNQIFGSVQLMLDNAPFSLTPAQFSDETIKSNVFKLSHKLGKQEEIREGNLSNDISILYAAPTLLINTFKEQYPNLQIKHSVESLIQWIEKNHKSRMNDIFCHLHGENLLIIAYKESKLLLANQFDCKTKDDVFFFILSTMEQLELDGETLTLNWLNLKDDRRDNDINAIDLFNQYIQTINVSQIYHLNHDIGCISVGVQSVISCAL